MSKSASWKRSLGDLIFALNADKTKLMMFEVQNPNH